MNRELVPSSPHLLRPVGRALVAFVAALMLGAVWIRAPLETAADPAHAPNPARAAWFLLWIQELVSHGTPWMIPVAVMVAAFVALPWFRRERIDHASWFPRGGRTVALASLALALAVLVLTVVAAFFRGEQWRFVPPF